LVACWRTRLDPTKAKRSTRAWWVWKRGWILIGVGLHATLLVLMNIGIFTTGMLAIYFCWLNPSFLARLPEGRLFAALRFVPEARVVPQEAPKRKTPRAPESARGSR
ncbi:hypothetical protein GW813_02025, partial [bacterium]|nr:hypothetical protein [bacterium]